MATLSPISEALDRSTPGFDALVGAIQQQTNRIIANKQFAKEVQARKEFAIFQSNLQLDQQIDLAQRLLPIELEKQEGFTDIRKDAEIELMGERQEDVIEGKLVDWMLRDREMTRKVELENENRPEPTYDASEARLQRDQDFRFIQSSYGEAAKKYGARARWYTQEGEMVPIEVQVGGENKYFVSWEGYQEFMRGENLRLQEINRLENVLDSSENIARGRSTDPSTMKLDDVRERILQLRNAEGYYITQPDKYTEVVIGSERREVARVIEPVMEKRNAFRTEHDYLESQGIPQMTIPRYDNDELRAMVGKEQEEYLIKQMLPVHEMTKHVEQAYDEDDPQYKSWFKLLETYQGTGDIPPNVQDLVLNPRFDPQVSSDFERAFITPQEYANILISDLNNGVIGEEVARHSDNSLNLAGPRANSRVRGNRSGRGYEQL